MRLLVHLVVLFALCGAGLAQTVLIHPFESGDGVLGTVVADRVAEALRPDADVVVGPAAAPSLVPPFPVSEGFLSPLAVLEEGGIYELHGAMLLRAGTGVDVAATGRIVNDAEGLRLDLVAAFGDGETLASTVRAPEDRPATLARTASLLLASRAGLPVPDAPRPIDMAGADDALGRALALLAGGFGQEAEALFEAAGESGDAPRLAQLSADLGAVREGRPATDAALGASLALTVLADDERTLGYMGRLADAGVPAAHAWIGAIATSINDLARADDAYAAAAAYPYGAAASAAHERSQGRDEGDAALARAGAGDDPAALTAAALLAEQEGDPEEQRSALAALADAAPTMPYPFERLSFLAFDADDALAATQALVVATELEPENDLYWTNLGWSWYLLGFWDRSEAASERALELAPQQHIAAYNLGLVRARFGRLDEAMPAYERALVVDPEVDDEALRDVEVALEARPDEAALHYVLGRLYEAEGRRGEAADAYEAFLELGGGGDPYDDRASERVEALRAPPPPLRIEGGVEARLGPAGAQAPWHPGDPLALRFEVITPGEALPPALTARAALRSAGGGDAAAEDAVEAPVVADELRIDVPPDAIGYVVEDLTLTLPEDLAAGTYELVVRVEGVEDQATEAVTTIEVVGEPQVLRRLVGRGVTLTSLSGGRPLFGAGDVGRSDVVVGLLVQELRDAVEAAAEALPTVESGRFEGLGGRELFETSSEDDVRDFLAYLVNEGVRDVRLTFVDAYAQWALGGAP